ncbi:MAG: hypothetical protein CVU85_03070 [Firmicutes bacterium HGW-Firmicutes-10]|jgi:predicted phage replisome organizer|nr:MAG: hypothetical protein CVU85_03070 [Firmicutes bacterium HGW-Firmicutes-10]
MTDIRWVKLASDIFKNRKITQIRDQAEGNDMALIWIQLMCLAADTNDCGLIYFSDNVPYTIEMLAVELKHPIERVEKALGLFTQFNMISIKEKVISILNWEVYQNIEKLEIIKEYNRIKKQEQRAKQKKQSEIVVSKMSGTSQGSQDIELALDIAGSKKKVKEKSNKKESGQPLPKDGREFPSYGIILGSEHLYPVDEENCNEGDSTMSSQCSLN